MATRQPNPSSVPSHLVICPTPLGNLGDITQRTLDALQRADVVCAEDTRITGKLLAAFGIAKRLERLDEEQISHRIDQIIERMHSGEVVAYCSDAGMPGISDPGMRLVRAAQNAQISVEVLPGPSAVITAYVASGVTSPRFYFGGFFPRRQAEAQRMLAHLKHLDAALIFYESPHRVMATLSLLSKVFPAREGALCRELTKLHEEVVRAPLPHLYDMFAHRITQAPLKGELVVVIDAASQAETLDDQHKTEEDARQRVRCLQEQGRGSRAIASALEQEFGLSRNKAYDLALGK